LLIQVAKKSILSKNLEEYVEPNAINSCYVKGKVSIEELVES
jgi:hypothetical protein